MAAFSSILCAVDSSDLAPRVIRHAAGLAGVCGAHLTVVTVSSGHAWRAQAAASALLSEVVPAGAPYVEDPKIHAVRVAAGRPVDAILELARDRIDLIVVGTHAKSGLGRWILGSTSAALLDEAQLPVLLVPQGELDIVTLTSETASLHPGCVLVAVDLAEENLRQLTLASELATLAGQPLVLLTVPKADMSDRDAEDALRARARGVRPEPVARVIIRRGTVAEEIDRAAVDEHAGLVVMGLRARARGTPGGIATAVLR